MSLFKRPTDKAAYFVPTPGTYIGELKSLEPFDKGKFGPSIRWTWIVFDINSKEPVLFEDKPATTDALSGTDMGPRAKARAWANKHLAPDREVVEDEDPDALMKELIGKRVKLNFTIKEDENGNEQVVLGSIFAYTG